MKELIIKRDLLRAVNRTRPNRPHDLQLEDVTFGAPELFLQGNCNSRVRITAKDTSVVALGTAVIHYNRQRIDTFLKGVRVPGKSSDYASSQDVIQALADLYGFPLDPNDFVFSAIVPGQTAYIQPLNTCIGFFQNFTVNLPFMGDINPTEGLILLDSFKLKIGWYKAPQWSRGFFRTADNNQNGTVVPNRLNGASVLRMDVATDKPHEFQLAVSGGVMPVIRAITINELPVFSYTRGVNTTGSGSQYRYFENGVTDLYAYFGEYIDKEIDVKLWM